MKRRCLDTLALNALMKATHLLGLALRHLDPEKSLPSLLSNAA